MKGKETIFLDPKTRAPLVIKSKGDKEYALVDAAGNEVYSSIDGIFRIIRDEEVTGKNKRYQALYDKIAWWYDLLEKIIIWWCAIRKKESSWEPFFTKLAIKPDEKVLEVAIGTGANVSLFSEQSTLYGVDISLKMLRKCRRKMPRMKRSVMLMHAMAESLPFEDASFDVVYHIGGINFFTDKATAISEMIRVAKPGARFLISDETEELAKQGEKIPITKWFFKNRDEEIVPPVDLIPSDMRNVKLEYICDNSLYVITFTKPI